MHDVASDYKFSDIRFITVFEATNLKMMPVYVFFRVLLFEKAVFPPKHFFWTVTSFGLLLSIRGILRFQNDFIVVFYFFPGAWIFQVKTPC